MNIKITKITLKMGIRRNLDYQMESKKKIFSKKWLLRSKTKRESDKQKELAKNTKLLWQTKTNGITNYKTSSKHMNQSCTFIEEMKLTLLMSFVRKSTKRTDSRHLAGMLARQKLSTKKPTETELEELQRTFSIWISY